MQLQEYSFEVVYRSGKENLVADALTTLPEKEPIQEILLIEQFNIDEIMEIIKAQQQNDEFCTKITNYLKLNILPEDTKQSSETITWSRFMGIADDLLHHFWTCILDKCIKQRVIPTSIKQQALKFAHNL